MKKISTLIFAASIAVASTAASAWGFGNNGYNNGYNGTTTVMATLLVMLTAISASA